MPSSGTKLKGPKEPKGPTLGDLKEPRVDSYGLRGTIVPKLED